MEKSVALLLVLGLVRVSHSCLNPPEAYTFTGAVCRLTYPAAVVCKYNTLCFLCFRAVGICKWRDAIFVHANKVQMVMVTNKA